MRLILLGFFLLLHLLSSAAALAGPTLDTIRANRVIRCGVAENRPGISVQDEAGQWRGFDVDFCRAVAAAVLGQADRVAFVPVTSVNRFPVLLSGSIDLLMRMTTYTFEREAAIGVQFAGIINYDGQAFLVTKKSGIRRLADLNGATIGFGKRTTHENNLTSYFGQRGWTYKPRPFRTLSEAKAALLGGEIQALTSNRSELAAIRIIAPGEPEDYIMLPEEISKEPLGPVVSRGDDEWFILIKWVLYALIEAEERGVTQANVRTLLTTSTDPVLQNFLDSDGLSEKALGISPGWVVRVIEAVGNYGEIYERNLGSRSPLKLERGLNRLWNQGGLVFAPPFR
ncbi:MAG: amino acid ABC transporter substrate-binding protein [Deltaproteobacteria bacterium]|nr:amino acid ABC transporter substrate-binding protein [Deltaproteobacteria bacterium]